MKRFTVDYAPHVFMSLTLQVKSGLIKSPQLKIKKVNEPKQPQNEKSKIVQFGGHNLPIDDGINEFLGQTPGLGEYCKI